MLNRTLTISAIVLAATGAAIAQDKGPDIVSIDASSAMIEGSKVTNISAEIDRAGYLVIHNDAAGAPPASLGHVRLNPGRTGDISIDTGAMIDPASNVTLMLHYETNDNNSYDFGPGSTDVDGPVMVGDTVANVAIGDSM
ncbi:MAG: hypothetical protein JJ969_16100 [Rhizobiaceae bacterium]|jgi:hypothetical protein|nr:hypothetical protein [Rhizobiaceae bacterium]MBO6724815.1 hypothetical protein [Rhizobiaceae bacterium]